MEEQPVAAILWRGKWLIAVSLVFSVALAVFITEQQHKVYASSAILQVVSPETTATTAGTSPLDRLLAGQTIAQNYATLIDDRGFLAKIRKQVQRGRYTTSELEHRITASAIKDTTLISVKAEESSPQLASALAGDVARAFLRSVQSDSIERTKAQKAQIEAQITALSKTIEKLSKSSHPADAETVASARLARAALITQLGALVASSIAQGGSVTLSAPPTPNTSPIRPRPLLNVLAGVMLGLLLGVILSWLRVRLDRGLETASEVEELVSAPVLASIPIRKRYMADDPVVHDAYDVLRANLAFLSLEQALQVVSFTSYNPGEGKTATVEGLAYAAVRGGMSVLVVDGDTRTASLSKQFAARAMPGLTNVIVGGTSLDKAVYKIEQGLSLLPAGPTPPNPASLLSSGRTRSVISDLRERHSLIIIDTPPVAHLADAAILAAISDGVVLVARVGITSRADLPAAAANLRHGPTPIVGAVVFQRQTVDETYYPISSDSRTTVSESLSRQ
jgi:capsular exopolysaccharide synthesis family protein